MHKWSPGRMLWTFWLCIMSLMHHSKVNLDMIWHDMIGHFTIVKDPTASPLTQLYYWVKTKIRPLASNKMWTDGAASDLLLSWCSWVCHWQKNWSKLTCLKHVETRWRCTLDDTGEVRENLRRTWTPSWVCSVIPNVLLKDGLKLIDFMLAKAKIPDRESSAKAKWKDSVAKASRKWFLRSSQFHCAKATVAFAKAFAKVFSPDKAVKQDFQHCSIEFDFLALARLDKSIDRTLRFKWAAV